jgi:hypothetical protein
VSPAQIPPEALELLDRVADYNEPVSRGELELYVPPEYRTPGPDWIFTRGVFLTRTNRSRSQRVHSIAGFDVADENGVIEKSTLYEAVYGFYDHEHRLYAFALPPFVVTDGYVSRDIEMRTSPGSAFIMSFDRRSPTTHRRFDERWHDTKSDVAWVKSLK